MIIKYENNGDFYHVPQQNNDIDNNIEWRRQNITFLIKKILLFAFITKYFIIVIHLTCGDHIAQ